MANPPTTTAPRAKLVAMIGVWMPAITALVAIALAVAAYFLLLVPKIQPLLPGGEYDFSSIKSQLADDEAYVQKVKGVLSDFGKIDEENRLRINAIMPFDTDVPGLLVQVDEIARANKMVMQSMDTATDEKNVSPLGRKTVRISVSVSGGDYEQFKLFLGDIERSLRLFDIMALTFSADGNGYGVVMKSYYIDRKVQTAVVGN